jgi:lysophospholipase L1-like esterase
VQPRAGGLRRLALGEWPLRLIVALVVAGAFEASSTLALWHLERKGVRYEPLDTELLDKHRELLSRITHQQPTYLDHDPLLGWSPRPLGSTPLYRANAAGLRADREYPLEPPPGAFRVAAFGDSFVHGDEVAFADTWGQQLEAEMAGLELINFGVSGYGVDQALLRYQSVGRRYGARVVLIGFMTEDLGRAVSTFRPFQFHDSSIALAKPRFVLEAGRLRLLPNPFPRREDYESLLRDETASMAVLGAHDAEYQARYHPSAFDFLRTVRVARLAWQTFVARTWQPPLKTPHGSFNPRSEAFSLNLALIEAFVAAVKADGAIPLVVLFPGRTDPRFAARAGVAPYEPLRQALVARGVPVLDLIQAIVDAGTRDDTTPLFGGGHYSAAGNRVVARVLALRLAALAHGTYGDAVDQLGRQQAHEAPQASPQR